MLLISPACADFKIQMRFAPDQPAASKATVANTIASVIGSPLHSSLIEVCSKQQAKQVALVHVTQDSQGYLLQVFQSLLDPDDLSHPLGVRLTDVQTSECNISPCTCGFEVTTAGALSKFAHHMLSDATIVEGQLLHDASAFNALSVIVHNGTVFMKPGRKGSGGYLRAIRSIAVAARRDAHLSVELLLNTIDHPQQHNKTGTPLFSMCRSSHTFDIPAPNPCGVVDNICASRSLPWSRRKDVVFARFSYFCGRSGIGGCQRTFFSRLAKNKTATFMTNLSWDVAPVNRAYGTEVMPRPFVPIEEWPGFKYLLSTDGLSSACRFGQSLAMGSVTLKVRSSCKMWFEYFVRPGADFVSVWNEDAFDIIPKLIDLRRNEARAASIAASGRTAACYLLSTEGHVAYWAEMLRQYQTLMTYRIDKPVIERRGAVRVIPEDISCQETNWLCSWRGA
jgi:hypothetical protein